MTRKTTTGFATNLLAQQVLKDLGFPAFRVLPNEGRLASVLPESWSSGIYVFECQNGEGYVGQTRGQLSTRLNAHRARIADIRAVTFLRTRRSMLDQFEREVHEHLQRAGVRLKNETFVQLEPQKPLRLADILSPDEQALWVSVPGFIINDDERPLEGERTTRAEQMFDAFEAHPASFWMLRAMGRYVWRTIPNPRKSERRYWSVTLRMEADDHVSLRLNVGAQTVLDLVGGPNWETDVRIFVPRERFERAFPFRLPTHVTDGAEHEDMRFIDDPDFATLRCTPSWMVEAGSDQFSVRGLCEPMMTLLERESWIREARSMHLDMMQRRKGINGRSHNPYVGDVILECDVEELLRLRGTGFDTLEEAERLS
jgi:hypothetical protein